MFVSAKWRKMVVNKVACSIKYLLITEKHSNMNARTCTPVKYQSA